jgi:hypothetical protein
MLLPKVVRVVNYTASQMLKIVASLMIIIYDWNMFVVQAIHLGGAMILSIMTLSITTFSPVAHGMQGSYGTLMINNILHNNALALC